MKFVVDYFLREPACVHDTCAGATADSCLLSWPSFIVFLIHHIGTDIETHRLCCISHSYNGLSFFESKMDLPKLCGCVHHFCSSPIYAPQVGNRMAFDQDDYGVYYCNENKGKYRDIHGGLLFPLKWASHFDTRERLGSDPLRLGGTGDLRKTERQQMSLYEAAVLGRKTLRRSCLILCSTRSGAQALCHLSWI
jgi:hypothetical protein